MPVVAQPLNSVYFSDDEDSAAVVSSSRFSVFSDAGCQWFHLAALFSYTLASQMVNGDDDHRDPNSRWNLRLDELFDKMTPESTVSATKIFSLYLYLWSVFSVAPWFVLKSINLLFSHQLSRLSLTFKVGILSILVLLPYFVLEVVQAAAAAFFLLQLLCFDCELDLDQRIRCAVCTMFRKQLSLQKPIGIYIAQRLTLGENEV